MGKNDNFTTSASGAADVNKVLEAKSRTSIFRDEVFKDIEGLMRNVKGVTLCVTNLLRRSS